MTPEEKDSNGLTHSSSFKRKRLRRPRARILRSWPYVVWVLAALIVAHQHNTGSQFGGISGVVEGVEELVAPLENARVVSIDVIVGQRVKTGDIIARMDSSLVDMEIAIVNAEQIEAAGSISGYQQNILEISQRFGLAIREAKSELARIRAEQRSEVARLVALTTEQKRRDNLVKGNYISMQEATELRPEIAALEKQVDGYPELIAIYENRVAGAMKERDELGQWLRIGTNEPIHKVISRKMAARNAITVASLAALELKKERHTMRAERDGVVAEVFRQPGDVLGAGQQLARITSEHSNRVIGFLPETFLNSLQVDQDVFVWRVHNKGRRIRAKVVSIAPDVRALPQRITPLSGQVVRGRRVIMNVEGDHSLITGETVRIRPVSPTWSLPSIKQLFNRSS